MKTEISLRVHNSSTIKRYNFSLFPFFDNNHRCKSGDKLLIDGVIGNFLFHSSAFVLMIGVLYEIKIYLLTLKFFIILLQCNFIRFHKPSSKFLHFIVIIILFWLLNNLIPFIYKFSIFLAYWGSCNIFLNQLKRRAGFSDFPFCHVTRRSGQKEAPSVWGHSPT